MNETAEAILDAAEERIRGAGYSGFSYRDVAADVGVKASSVHYHFPAKEKLAAAVARRYTDRFLEAVDQRQAAGADIVAAWRQVFREALHRDARMCLCGAMAATSHDLAEEVRVEVRRFFLLGIERLMQGGLERDAAVHVIATLEGAMLAANVLDDHSLFDSGTAALI
ncbi:TetR family transcriptional regulator [Rhizobium phaseoli]|uniref:Transcriptional regulator n=2 Tax=Rhizobium TaxID=379 RepID=I9NLW7_RHILT|nr:MULTISPECIES: TetR/AcrR family transcriptional regulator [Rhizobium]EJB07807.1 transcriptional regulator [Rhizobium leguminosarum bv. trifolii WSM597]MBB3650416.1 TetR/AcrR family transcriptional repressor of nem operon [Rhizobium sp. BK619]NEJ74871.1 TetR family transcriptional regulator [Rhizobium phaseoli]